MADDDVHDVTPLYDTAFGSDLPDALSRLLHETPWLEQGMRISLTYRRFL